MSSNIRLRKVCQHCNKSFIAKTTVTKFCSDDCAKRNYKKRKRDKKITEAILDANEMLTDAHVDAKSVQIPTDGIERLNRDWLKIEDLSTLLGITERTIYRAIKRSGFPKVKVGRRLLFNKRQVMDYLNSKSEGYERNA
jgi:excisionase family DNA binding protein